MGIFFLLVLSLFVGTDLLWWRWADRRLRPLKRGKLWRWLLGAFMAGQIAWLLYFLMYQRLLGNSQAGGMPWAQAATYIWHLLLVPVLLVLLVCDGLVHLTVGLVRCAMAPKPPMPEMPVGVSRRQLIGAALAAAPPLLVGGAVARSAWQMDEFRIRRLELAVAQLPRELDGLSIAHVSDIHVGQFTRGRVLDRIVQATNGLRADLVLLSGDLIDFSLTDLPEGIDAVRRMDARYALAMCEGNHDLFESRELFDARVKQSGIPLLIDETMSVRIGGRRVQILGMQWGPRHAGGTGVMDRSMARLNAQRDPEAFAILLAHHPHAFDHAAAAGIPLTLAGHTHGGQLMLTERLGFGPAMYRYWSGHYRQADAHLVVSNGVGNWFPLRINAPAEIVQITLRSP